MIGNDVIDLIAAAKESNWQRRGFLQKIFVAHEQEMIQASSEPERMVWILWSMKEAAYKIYNRATGVRAFIPHLLQCHINDDTCGFVVCNNKVYYTNTAITNEEMIHTVAVSKEDDLVRIQEISMLNILRDELGMPYKYGTSSNIKIPVSVSHHGRFEKVVYIN